MRKARPAHCIAYIAERQRSRGSIWPRSAPHPRVVNPFPPSNSLQPSPFQGDKNSPGRAGYFPKIATLFSGGENDSADALGVAGWPSSGGPPFESSCRIVGQSVQNPQKTAPKPLVLTIFQNNPFALNGLEEMIEPHPAQKYEVRPKTPVGG
jgi:hypothetical protein